MKKHIFSLLLALLLILTAAPAAYAATEIDLGSVTAGSDVKVYISEMPFGVVESVSLPSGCYIESENGSICAARRTLRVTTALISAPATITA